MSNLIIKFSYVVAAVAVCAFRSGAETEFNKGRTTLIWGVASEADTDVEVEVNASSMVPGARCVYETKAEDGQFSQNIKLFPGENVVTTRTASDTYDVFMPFSVSRPNLRIEMSCEDHFYHLVVNRWSDGGGGDEEVETYYQREAAAGLYRISVYHMLEGLEVVGYDENGSPIWQEAEPVDALTTVKVFVNDELVHMAFNSDGKECWSVGTVVLHSGDQVGGYATDGKRLDLADQGAVYGMSPGALYGSRCAVTGVWGANGVNPVFLSVGEAIQFGAQGMLCQLYYGANQSVDVIDCFTSSDESVGSIDALGVFVAKAPGHTQISCRNYSGTPIDVYVLRGVEMAMDGNRDGEINFDDPDDKRYLFWVNDDYDYAHRPDAPFDWTRAQDDDSPAKHLNKDCDDDYIGQGTLFDLGCERDLEDFARLHVRVDDALLNMPGVSFSLRFENIDGSPKINLFEAITSDEKYLTDDAIAHDQINKRSLTQKGVSDAEMQLDKEIIRAHGETTPFLLEGCRQGAGKLVLSAKIDGREVARCFVRLDFRPIKFFYDVYRVSATGEKWSSKVDMIADQPIASGYKPKTNEKLLLVHGWNMPEWEKRSWAATTFKRLWWQGYQGSVALFDWPTLYDFGGFWDVTTNLRHFDNSEFRAWLSSDALAAKFAHLNSDGQLRVLAHSMGNVVAASALRKYTGRPLHTYVATQAALSAQYFDSAMASNYPAFKITRPDTPDILGHFPPKPTPYLGSVLSLATYKFNYYNEDDWALKHWETNNRLKPDGVYGYGYSGSLTNYQESVDRFYRGNLGLTVADERSRFEIFAYCAESRSLSLGQVGGFSGFSGSGNWDLKASPLGFNGKHYSHSRQFRSFVAKERLYWQTLSDNCRFLRPNRKD